MNQRKQIPPMQKISRKPRTKTNTNTNLRTKTKPPSSQTNSKLRTNTNPQASSTRKDWSTVRERPDPPDLQPGALYTHPSTKYMYEIMPWEAFIDGTYTGYKSIRSSFIPYVVREGVRYWVLGSFHDFPRDILMDFGGSCIMWDPPKKYAQGRRQMRNYQHQFGCAMLELNEESKGLLVQPVLKSLGTTKPVVYRGTDEMKKEYVWFVIVELTDDPEIRDIGPRFEEAPYVLKDEPLGPVDFYKETDILGTDSPYRTSKNLTDLVNYLRDQ